MLRDELRRLFTYEERHRRLLSRLTLLVIATAMIDLAGAISMYALEHNAKASEIRTYGQAAFFTTVQLLTISSQIKNPVTPAGRVVDVVLELWGVIAIAGSAGAIASFFQSGDAE